MKRPIGILIAGIIAALSLSGAVRAHQFFKSKKIDFFYRIARLPTDSPDTSLVWFNFAFPYDHLVFVSSDTGYSAAFHFSLFVVDKDHNQLFEKSWRQSIFTPRYEDTNSDSIYCQFSTFYKLPVGKYRLIMEATDQHVKKPEYFERELEIDDYSGKRISIGDLIVFSGKHDFRKERFEELKTAATNIVRQDFTLMTQIYLNNPNQKVDARVFWFDDVQKIREDSLHIHKNKRTLTLFRAYDLSEVPQGEFEVQFRMAGEGMRTKGTSATLEIIKPLTELDEQFLDRAIEQMVYIGEGAAWDSLRHARTLAEKKNWFRRFWQEYYPYADSTRNPAMEEYFRRVRVANRRFRDEGEGWRTDRGKIYILYGPPDEVQRSVDNLMRRYEIWSYFKLEKQFVFMDMNESGRFRLIRTNDL